MRRKLAIVICAHHKPWLVMGTWLTFFGQEWRDADVFVVYNEGDGTNTRESYGEYEELASRLQINSQLSPFDRRVERVCNVQGVRLTELRYQNDHALDSGVWYKFIRSGAWRDYDYVLFLGEGTLLAHPQVLRGLVAFAERRSIHFVASGHEKRRLPKRGVLTGGVYGDEATPMDRFHARMIAKTFDVFCRDPAFRSIYQAWHEDTPAETEHHVPGVRTGRELSRRVRSRIQRRWGSVGLANGEWRLGGLIWHLPYLWDFLRSRVGILMAETTSVALPPIAFTGGSYEVERVAGVADHECGVTFHCVEGPEWFGCATNHFLSHAFLERFAEELDHFGMYDVLDLPFAGSALEVVWGMLPAWLGFEKWFTNGLHRVRKNFATYQREDYPPEISGYINRYHRGRLAVGWAGDYLRLRAWRPGLGDLSGALPEEYFAGTQTQEIQ